MRVKTKKTINLSELSATVVKTVAVERKKGLLAEKTKMQNRSTNMHDFPAFY